jgi:hypothetical protein
MPEIIDTSDHERELNFIFYFSSSSFERRDAAVIGTSQRPYKYYKNQRITTGLHGVDLTYP